MTPHDHRDPEALLRQIEAAERAEHRGQLKIFLGYASGVGKSFKLFDEGRRRRERGEDVVIAAMQPDEDAGLAEIIRALPIIPTKNDGGVPVIDVPTVIARHPQVCLVDGLAYANPPRSRHLNRYQDVDELLESGISVLTSINLEYIAEQREFVRGVLGTTKSETVPQAFVDRAEELVIVDAPTDGETGIEDQQLSQLRQRALLLTADVVDRQLEAYLRLYNIQSTWGTQERILVCMTPRANAARMLASGRRNADRFHGELLAIYVMQENLTDDDRMALERNVTLARAQQARVETLEGKDPVRTILEYAREHGVTQIFVGHNLRRSWRSRLGGTPLDRLIRDAEGIDVRVFPQ
ncbi:MAG TPA: universal stress protein [Vicinamibacterales bacterium]|nr:universal stress protein [Vicinamibacterales bacterium]